MIAVRALLLQPVEMRVKNRVVLKTALFTVCPGSVALFDVIIAAVVSCVHRNPHSHQTAVQYVR